MHSTIAVVAVFKVLYPKLKNINNGYDSTFMIGTLNTVKVIILWNSMEKYLYNILYVWCNHESVKRWILWKVYRMIH